MVRYATVAQVKAQKTSSAQNALNVTDDDRIIDDIEWASARLERETGHRFEPYVKTYYYDATRSNELMLTRPLLSMSGVILGDTTALTANDYLLTPRGETPYWSLSALNGYSWATYTDSPRDATGLTGVWGYHGLYDEAWVDATTLTDALDNSATTFAVADVGGLAVEQLIRVDDEFMRVTAINGLNLTVKRGINGSTKAAHDAGAQVEHWQVDELANRFVVRLAAYMLSRRGAFERASYDGLQTVTYPDDLPKECENILQLIPRYWYIGSV
jgi:hypothetical protein